MLVNGKRDAVYAHSLVYDAHPGPVSFGATGLYPQCSMQSVRRPLRRLRSNRHFLYHHEAGIQHNTA